MVNNKIGQKIVDVNVHRDVDIYSYHCLLIVKQDCKSDEETFKIYLLHGESVKTLHKKHLNQKSQ